MVSYESVTVSRVRNGYIVERPWVPTDPGRQLDETRVFNDFDDLVAHLEQELGNTIIERETGARQIAQEEGLELLLRTIRNHDLEALENTALRLQTQGGEEWAVGEMLYRALGILLDEAPEFNPTIDPAESRKPLKSDLTIVNNSAHKEEES